MASLSSSISLNDSLSFSYITKELDHLDKLHSKAVIKKIHHGKFHFEIKKEFQEEILITIKRLGLTCKIFRSTSQTLQGRVNFIGSDIFKRAEQNQQSPHIMFEQKIFNFLYPLGDHKNALQLESFLFGPFHQLFYSKSVIRGFLAEIMSSDQDILNDIFSVMPDLSHRIEHLAREKMFAIDISPLVASLDAQGMNSLSLEFDRVMLHILSLYEYRDSKLYLPMDRFPSGQFAEFLITNKDPNVKILGQLLFVCMIHKMEIDLIGYDTENLKLTFRTLSTLSADPFQSEESPKYVFSEYMSRSALIPFICALLAKRDSYLAKGLPFDNIAQTQEDIDDIIALAPLKWFEEPVKVYDLILRIEKTVSSFLSHTEMQKAKFFIERDTSDLRIHLFLDSIREIFERRGLKMILPIAKGETYCKTVEDFRFLHKIGYIKSPNHIKRFKGKKKVDAKQAIIDNPQTLLKSANPTSIFLKYYLQNTSLDGDLQHQDQDFSEKPTAAAKALACDVSVEVKEDSFTNFDDEQSLLDDEKNVVALCKAVQSPVSKSFTDHLEESLVRASEHIQSITMHPRVISWMHSSEEGLKSHRYDASHLLSIDEMILRHRLPREILSLVMNPFFSKKTSWKQKEGYQSYESLALINKVKYIIEATLSPQNCLYHLYARPIRSWQDYYSLTIDAPSEFPALGPKFQVSDSPIKLKENLSIQKNGNILINFESRTYEFILLSANDRLD
jgi:hypothetical protein